MIDLVIYFERIEPLTLRAYNEATAEAYCTYALTFGAYGIERTDHVLQ